MTHEGVRAATKKAVGIAEEAGALISFDPNLRPPLWGDMDEAREQNGIRLRDRYVYNILHLKSQ